MKIPERIALPTVDIRTLELSKALVEYSYKLSGILNNGIRFSDNFNSQTVAVADTGAANVEFTVSHTLGRVPSGYIVIKNSVSGNIYNGATAWTATAIYLKHSGANAAITVIVL